MSPAYRRSLTWRVGVRMLLAAALYLVPGSVLIGETVITNCGDCRVTEEVRP